MDIRYSCNQRDFKRYTTEEVRNEFLITDLYKADEMVAVYSTLGWINWLMVRLLQVSRVPSGRLAASARVISLVS